MEDIIKSLKGVIKMKLLDFEFENKKYCIVKQDNYNFCVLEYLPIVKEVVVNGKIYTNEFKAPYQYYGTLEYAIRKAFRILRRDYIPKEKFSLFCPTYDSLKSIFKLRPSDINTDNVTEVRELLLKVTGLDEVFPEDIILVS